MLIMTVNTLLKKSTAFTLATCRICFISIPFSGGNSNSNSFALLFKIVLFKMYDIVRATTIPTTYKLKTIKNELFENIAHAIKT